MCKILTFILMTLALCNGYRILGLFPLPGRSHFNVFERLMKGLAEKGHEMDVLSHFPQNSPISGYNDLSVLGTIPMVVNNITVATMCDKNIVEMFYMMTNNFGTDLCEPVLNSQTAKDLKFTTKQYDLIITEIFGSDCLLGFAHLFNIPVIGMISSVNLPWASSRIGMPDNPSYIPNYFLPYSSPMKLSERLFNTITLVGLKLGYQWESVEPSNKIYKKFFGPNTPHLGELIEKTNLILVNSHFSMNQVRPMVPNFIEIGGIHIDTPKALPKHIEEILNSSANGVVYFSLGSIIVTESIPVPKLKALFDAFRKLPYEVLWKGNKHKMPKDVNIPPNIYFQEWMPQLDILCHPKVKLFITHGGLLGSQEAVYCAVPQIGIPLFADQTLNIRTVEKIGLAIMISYDNITEESIYAAANELLTNPIYKKNCVKISKLFRDRPMSPLDTAIYWVEYVVRYNGAKHLRNIGADLPWYQYFLVDVILIMLSFLILFTTIAYYLIKWGVRYLILGNKKSKHE